VRVVGSGRCDVSAVAALDNGDVVFGGVMESTAQVEAQVQPGVGINFNIGSGATSAEAGFAATVSADSGARVGGVFVVDGNGADRVAALGTAPGSTDVVIAGVVAAMTTAGLILNPEPQPRVFVARTDNLTTINGRVLFDGGSNPTIPMLDRNDAQVAVAVGNTALMLPKTFTSADAPTLTTFDTDTSALVTVRLVRVDGEDELIALTAAAGGGSRLQRRRPGRPEVLWLRTTNATGGGFVVAGPRRIRMAQTCPPGAQVDGAVFVPGPNQGANDLCIWELP
jgi:hypothetical protein